MIILEQKPFEKILGFLKDEQKTFLVGCSLCATTCEVGGEKDLAAMKEKLEKAGKTVTGMVVMEAACHAAEAKKKLRENKEQIEGADSILTFSCGGGAQSLVANSERIKIKKCVHCGTNTLFQGEVIRSGHYEERCSLCGECVLEQTGGICPITRCAKGLLNGPCGGSSGGKCEVDSEKDCAWALIHKRLKEMGQLERMKKIKAPKDYSKHIKPQSFVQGGNK